MRWLVGLLLLVSSALAADPTTIIPRLGDEDFEKREQAQAELGKFPTEYSRIFLAMSVKQTDPEVGFRLKLAAKQVYFNTIITKSHTWKTLHGCFPITYNQLSIYQVEEMGGKDGWGPSRRLTLVSNGCMVMEREKALESTLNVRDVIIADFNNMSIEADKEYTFTVRRYKDAEAVGRDVGYIDDNNREFEEKEVKITAGWKQPWEVSYLDEEKIVNAQWKEFLNAVEEESQIVPDAAAKH